MSKRAINIMFFGMFLFLFPSTGKSQVTLSVEDVSGYRGSHNNGVGVSLTNSVKVSRVQVDVCEIPLPPPDLLTVLSCDTTDRSKDGFTCLPISLPSGCVRVVLMTSPGGVIDAGTGPVFTLGYNVSSSATDGQCRVLELRNENVKDKDNNLLSASLIDGEFCFENCGTSGNCEDGLYCNGAEGCSGGACTHTGDPCPGSECDTCQEDTNSCFDPAGTPCTDDGLYCNGEEICNGSGSCTHAGSPCPLAPFCDEGNDLCECNVASDCEDGVYCNGGDFCAAGGVCEHVGDPCTSQGFYCDETVSRCTCRVNADCDNGNVCTDDSCGVDGACKHLNNTAPCDDGIYCNGDDDACSCGELCPFGKSL